MKIEKKFTALEMDHFAMIENGESKLSAALIAAGFDMDQHFSYVFSDEGAVYTQYSGPIQSIVPELTQAEKNKLIEAMADMIQTQKLDEDGKHFVKDAAMGFNLCCDFTADKLRKLAKSRAHNPPEEELTKEDYEEVLAGHRRIVRQIDVIMNGEEGAAKQASLIDLVGQIEDLVEENKSLKGEYS